MRTASISLLVVLLGTATVRAEGAPRLDPAGGTAGWVVAGVPETIVIAGRVCAVDPPEAARLEENGSVLRPAVAFADRPLRLSWVPAGQECRPDAPTFELYLASEAPWLKAREPLTIWFDAQIADLKAPELAGYQLAVLHQGKVAASAPCAGSEACSVGLDEKLRVALVADRESLKFVLLRAGIQLRAEAEPPLFLLASGESVDADSLALPAVQFVFSSPLISETRLDTALDRWVIEPRFPAALEKVSCDRALCRLLPQGVLIFQLDPQAASIRLSYTLKPGFLRRSGERQLGGDTITLRLERCVLRAAKSPLLAGVDNQSLLLRLPAGCSRADLGELSLKSRPPTGAWLRGELSGPEADSRLLEVHLEQVPRQTSSVQLVLFEQIGGLRRLGSVRVPVAADFLPEQIRLEVPGLGLVDHIPSNLEAHLLFGTSQPVWRDRLVLESRPGFYRAGRDQNGWTVQGERGVSGNVPLRFGYRPPELHEILPPGTEAPTLATFDTDAAYSVRTVNTPLQLLGAEPGQEPFFKVVCGAPGGEKDIQPGKLTRLKFEERDTCRLIFQLDRIPRRAGRQRLHVRAGDFDNILTLESGSGTLTVAVPAGDRKEYDRLNITVAHDMLSGHYTMTPRQSLGEEIRYRVLLSDHWFRIGATTALPTGLFRFGSGEASGTVPISAGALVRGSYIQKDGREFPVGLEFGLFGTNLSGQADFSMVAGVGLSIPVLNPDTALQASFNIHAWLEVAPTRTGSGESPFAFLFGPSFTIGRVSTTF